MDDDKCFNAGWCQDDCKAMLNLKAENAKLREEIFICWDIIKNGANTPEQTAYVFDIPSAPKKST